MLGAEDIKNNPIPQVTTSQEINAPEVKPSDVVIPGELVKSKLAEMFNINNVEIGKYEHDMNRIIEYVNTFNPQNMDDVIYYVKSLGSRLGTSNLEKQIKTISRYLFLSNQKTQIERDLERMTNG